MIFLLFYGTSASVTQHPENTEIHFVCTISSHARVINQVSTTLCLSASEKGKQWSDLGPIKMTKICLKWTKKAIYWLVQTWARQRGKRNLANLNIQVEGLHQLLVHHGIFGSKHTESPHPTKAGEVMSGKSLFDRSFFSHSMSVLSNN